MKTQLFFAGLFLILVISSSCKKTNEASCPSADNILTQFVQPTGEEVIIDVDGNAFLVTSGECELALQYFDPNFREEGYLEENGNVFIKSSDGNFPVLKSIEEDFETPAEFLDVFYNSVDNVGIRPWGSMTLQSPAAKTVQEYVALRKCIFEETCDFIDNRIDLTSDPENSDNQCLKFTAVAKTDDMVVCKTSIQSTLLFFEKGDDLWFSGDFYIDNNLPFSIVDFENDHFDGSPGPRIVISNNRLAIENKFGTKEFFRHDKDIFVPIGDWFNVKIHFQFDESDNGILELWQDETLLFSLTGKTLPLINSIQNSLEVGISATTEASVLYVDNLKLSDSPF